MAKTSRSKKGGTCSGRKRPNPKKKKNLRFAELTSKLVKAGSKRFIAKVELKSRSCWNHGRTDRPVKEWKKEFRCNGMEKAKTILDALEWSIRPNLYLRQKSNEKKEHEAVARLRVCTTIERSTSKLMMDVNVIRTGPLKNGRRNSAVTGWRRQRQFWMHLNGQSAQTCISGKRATRRRSTKQLHA